MVELRHGRTAMTDSDGAVAPRPRQVTIGSGLALVSCVLLIFTMLDSMPRMRSVEMRDTVREALTTPPGSGLGIEVDTVLSLLRATVLLTGGLAAAGAVLAVYTLKRHHGARIGLSVVAVLMLFTATFVSGLLPLVVAIGVVMLWGHEAREWFAGRSPRPDPHAFSGPSRTLEQPVQPVARPAQPGLQQPYPQPGHPTDLRSRRPVTVTVAAWLTWAFSAITALFLLLLVVVLLADQERLVQALQDNPQIAAYGYSNRDLLGGMWVITAVGLFWCLAATALAVLAFRRVNLGRIGLVVSAVLAGILGVATLVGLLHAMAAFATVALLFSGGSNRWYAGMEPPRLPPPPPAQSPPPPLPPSSKPPVW
jgi:hypothetical protein